MVLRNGITVFYNLFCCLRHTGPAAGRYSRRNRKDNVMLDLCFLGTGGSIPLPNRALASLYIRHEGRAILLDCGEGTQIGIMRLGWGFRCIDTLLLTHYHADHCSGVPGFLLALAKAGREEPLHIYGPAGLRRVIEGLRVIAPQLPYSLLLHELPMDVSHFDACGLHIRSFPLHHGMPCLGYHFTLNRLPEFDPVRARELQIPISLWKVLQHGEDVTVGETVFHPADVQKGSRKGISFLYASDTRPVPIISAMGENTDLMILEGMYGEEDKLPLAHKNHHMLFRESAALARDANTRRLILTHFSTSMEHPEEALEHALSVFPETTCASDGLCVTLKYE